MEVKDEFRLHLYYISKLIQKYSRILVYAIPGEGKSKLLRTLSLKFPDVNFYDLGENVAEEPFVYTIISPEQINIPEFDIIYCVQYSTEYKEAQTGISFPPGEWRPMEEYVQKAEWNKKGQKNLAGRTVKDLGKLKELIS